MKKMIKLMAMVACMCAVFGIAGCGGNSPDAVVLDFLKTMQSGKADEAYLKANCTESAAKMFTLGLAMAKDEMMKNMEGVKFSVADTKIDGDKATVTVKMEGGKKDKDGKLVAHYGLRAGTGFERLPKGRFPGERPHFFKVNSSGGKQKDGTVKPHAVTLDFYELVDGKLRDITKH